MIELANRALPSEPELKVVKMFHVRADRPARYQPTVKRSRPRVFRIAAIEHLDDEACIEDESAGKRICHVVKHGVRQALLRLLASAFHEGSRQIEARDVDGPRRFTGLAARNLVPSRTEATGGSGRNGTW